MKSLVALRKESVDRNQQLVDTSKDIIKSLSARRAWIEIPIYPLPRSGTAVALRKESVDRNLCVSLYAAVAARRSPQGERG